LAKRLEEVFIPGNSDAQSIPKNSPGLILLRKIRDEAHRFAIKYQKQRRNKKVRESIFDSVDGMGPKRIQALLSSFEGIENIANADTSIIAKRANIPLKIAEDIILVAKRFQMEQKSK
jgi:excinuclease ABC subunit C